MPLALHLQGVSIRNDLNEHYPRIAKTGAMALFGRLSVLLLELRFQIYSYVFCADDHHLITLEFERLAEPRDGVLKPLQAGNRRQKKYHAHRRLERESLKERAWPETWPDVVEEAFCNGKTIDK